MKFIIPLVFLALSLSCGDADSEDNFQIIDQPLQGIINGEDWTLVHGIATMDEKNDRVFITMVPIAADETFPCMIPQSYRGPRILMSRKAEVAEGGMSFFENITFTYDGDGRINNDIATDGKWRFDFVDDDTIRGALVAKTEGHKVNGNFELIRCPDPFANF